MHMVVCSPHPLLFCAFVGVLGPLCTRLLVPGGGRRQAHLSVVYRACREPKNGLTCQDGAEVLETTEKPVYGKLHRLEKVLERLGDVYEAYKLPVGRLLTKVRSSLV